MRDYLHQEAIDTLPWPALSPDMNPIEYVWDQIKRQLDQRDPPCQNLKEIACCNRAGMEFIPTK